MAEENEKNKSMDLGLSKSLAMSKQPISSIMN